MHKLSIQNLHAEVEGKEILKGVNLEINSGEIHVIMGPNGTGKSTLSNVLMGNSKYNVTSGNIYLDDIDILSLTVDKRAQAGLFLAMQYPAEISGITNSDFLRTALNNLGFEESLIKYVKRLENTVDSLNMSKEMIHRYLNENFSGGEKKKNEILQMIMLKPKFAILDEIDSGLDIDALNIVGKAINTEVEKRKDEFASLIITHYKRLLETVKPTHIHIMLDGRIVESGNYSLVETLETKGYDHYKEKYGIKKEEKVIPKKSIGSCATHVGVNNGKN